jgi:hypothetical protein
MRSKIVLAGFLAIVVGSILLALRPTAESPISAPAVTTIAPPPLAPVPAVAKAPAVPEGETFLSPERIKRLQDDDLPSATEADCDRFLTARGETPANLVAAYDITRKRRYLERALALHPDSPLILFTALSNAFRSKESAEWIERFKKAAPENPLPWLFSARRLFDDDQLREGVAEVTAALTRPGLYSYAAEATAAIRSVYEWLGTPEIETEVLSIPTLPMLSVTTPQAVAVGLLKVRRPDRNTPEQIAEATRLQYEVGMLFQTAEARRSLIGEAVGLSVEEMGLGALPSGVAEKRAAEITAASAEIKEMVERSNKALFTLPESAILEFFRRRRTEGEHAAMRWLDARVKK